VSGGWTLSPARLHRAYDIQWTSRLAQDLPIRVYRLAPIVLSCNQLYKTLSAFVSRKLTNSCNGYT
jgi:hypothetical protein